MLGVAERPACSSGEDNVCLVRGSIGSCCVVSFAARKTTAVSSSSGCPKESLMKWHASTDGKGSHLVSIWPERGSFGFDLPFLLHLCDSCQYVEGKSKTISQSCGWTYTLSSESEPAISILGLPLQDYAHGRASQAPCYTVAAGWSSFVTPDLAPSALLAGVPRTTFMGLVTLGSLASRHDGTREGPCLRSVEEVK